MTAQGNNYIYLDNRDLCYDKLDFNALSRDVSDIRFGIGSDGLVVINKDAEADCFMRIFNSDGSEAKMCGNALRCVAYLISLKSSKSHVSINTLSGIKTAHVNLEESSVKVNMGMPKLIKEYDSSSLAGNLVDIGNLHLIVNKDRHNLTRDEFLSLAQEKQESPDFPDGVNIELIEILSRDKISALVYERGSGLTYACGSGATALFWDCYRKGLVAKTATINLDGGDIKVSLKNNNVILEGQIRIVCKGTFYWSI